MGNPIESMKYLVIGLGNTGLSILSVMKSAGVDVRGYNRKGKSLNTLKTIGRCKVNGIIEVDLPVDFLIDDLEEALSTADLVFICAPANEHKELAEEISSFFRSGYRTSTILVPGRVFGSLNFESYLGCAVAEAQTVPYAARHNGRGVVSLYASKQRVMYSSPDQKVLYEVSQKMPSCFNNIFFADPNYKRVTIENMGLVLHCAPMIFNAGLLKYPQDFLFYRDLVSHEIAHYMEKIDEERLSIGNACGVAAQSALGWLREQYSPADTSSIHSALHSTDAYKRIPAPHTLNHRYLNEDLAYGLVPLEALAVMNGVRVPHISSLIDMGCKLLNLDFRNAYQGLTPDWGKVT